MFSPFPPPFSPLKAWQRSFTQLITDTQTSLRSCSKPGPRRTWPLSMAEGNREKEEGFWRKILINLKSLKSDIKSINFVKSSKSSKGCLNSLTASSLSRFVYSYSCSRPWQGQTPLAQAALYGHKDVIKVLLDAGAKLDLPGLGGSGLRGRGKKLRLEFRC